jgi:hypothetical protein
VTTDAILAATRNHPEKIGGRQKKIGSAKYAFTMSYGDISTLFQGHFQTKLIIYKRAQIFIRRNRKMTNGIIIDMIWSMFFLILVL